MVGFKLCHVVTEGAWSPKKYKHGEFTLTDLFENPNLLVNYAHNETAPPKDKYWLMGDSGGLQNARTGKQFDPADVSRWYNTNVHAGLCLDKIPMEFEGSSETTRVWKGDDREFLVSCAKQTRSNVEAMVKAQDQYRLHYVYQGNDWPSFDVWHKHSAPELAQGLAFKQAQNHRINAAIFAFLWTTFHEQPPVHFMGVGGASRYIPLIFFSRYWKGEVSADSVRHKYGAAQRVYPNPIGLGEFRFGEENAKQLKELPCDCPACRLHQRDLTGFYEPTAPKEDLVWASNLLMAHNAWTEARRARLMTRMVGHKEYFFKVVRQHEQSFGGAKVEGPLDSFGVLQLLEFIELLCERGLDAATAKYPVLTAASEAFF